MTMMIEEDIEGDFAAYCLLIQVDLNVTTI